MWLIVPVLELNTWPVVSATGDEVVNPSLPLTRLVQHVIHGRSGRGMQCERGKHGRFLTSILSIPETHMRWPVCSTCLLYS